MNPLLEQFLSEARDLLQGIGEKLMQLEAAPDDDELMTVLFRMVHTLKGNSGLFDSPEMTRVLHAGEDLMDAVRRGQVAYSQVLADRLLDAMDFVALLCDEIEAGEVAVLHVADATRLVKALRELLPSGDEPAAIPASAAFGAAGPGDGEPPPLTEVPEAARMAVYRRARSGSIIRWLHYVPDDECFFRGQDPLLQVRNTPGLLWGSIRARQSWPALMELDVYRCQLDFQLLTEAQSGQIEEHYRDISEQISLVEVPRHSLVLPVGELDDGPADEDFVADAARLLAAGHLEALAAAARASLDRGRASSWSASALRWLLLILEIEPDNRAALAELIESTGRSAPAQSSEGRASSARTIEGAAVDSEAAPVRLTEDENEALQALFAVQRQILALPMNTDWAMGRAQAAAAVLASGLRASGDAAALPGLESATLKMVEGADAAPLLAWLDQRVPLPQPLPRHTSAPRVDRVAAIAPTPATVPAAAAVLPGLSARADGDVDSEPRVGRRAEDAPGRSKSLKVDQAKIDRLMNLIGEMVVCKNALPYLAGRAETVFGVRELGREIKAQYAVINRIAEDMQDAIMQVSMMPVSFIFQRFPRLVRDTSRKLGKEVELVLQGEETEADKNIIESLADPLVHIVRNSLDHGFESPEVRRAAGKPAAGTLHIRASQQSDRVVIEVSDDGKGIDPVVIKRKAYEKGLIDEATLESISDQDALNLIFSAGFSTVDVISDLSGRGVGMDVVKTAVAKVNGTLTLESEKGRGTSIRLSLPLSMAVTNVMIVETDGQLLGVPMDSVIETVRVARSSVRTIKKSPTIVLRGRIVPLKSVNTMLGLDAPPLANAEDELAVLVVRVGDESVGLLVDDFHETVDIILKPMSGVLAGLSIYSGTALMGDGTVLVILNVKELL